MIQVIDNSIPQEQQDFFEAITLGKVNNIEIDPLIEFKCKYEPTAKDKPLSLKHILKSSAALSIHLDNFSKIATSLFPNLQDILFARIFLTFPYKTKLLYHDPHIDLNFPHIGLIYYINDSDGDTIFFEDDYATQIKSVTPKKGRSVLFNGNIPHAAGIPTLGPRCIVNFNLI